jgi:hypothetical protein
MNYEVYSYNKYGKIVSYKSVWPVQNEPSPPEPEHIDSYLPFANVTDAEIRDMYPRYDWRNLSYDPSDYDDYDDDWLD